MKLKNYIFFILFIVYFTIYLSLTSTTMAQPAIDTLKIEKVTVSTSSTLLEVDTIITPQHRLEIEKYARSTPTGNYIWTYFGEIVIMGFSLLLLYIRVTVKTFLINLYKKIAKSEKDKNSYTNKDIEKIGELNEDINEYLTQIKEMTKSKRVLLYQFSNGSHFFSNIPVLRMAVTNYSDGDNIKATDNVFNYVTGKEIVHQILNDEYLEIKDTDTENKHSGYVSYLRFAKFKNSTIIRVNVSDNYCGVIELIEPTEFELATVRSYCISIGHLFERYLREKEETVKSKI